MSACPQSQVKAGGCTGCPASITNANCQLCLATKSPATCMSCIESSGHLGSAQACATCANFTMPDARNACVTCVQKFGPIPQAGCSRCLYEVHPPAAASADTNTPGGYRFMYDVKTAQSKAEACFDCVAKSPPETWDTNVCPHCYTYSDVNSAGALVSNSMTNTCVACATVSDLPATAKVGCAQCAAADVAGTAFTECLDCLGNSSSRTEAVACGSCIPLSPYNLSTACYECMPKVQQPELKSSCGAVFGPKEWLANNPDYLQQYYKCLANGGTADSCSMCLAIAREYNDTRNADRCFACMDDMTPAWAKAECGQCWMPDRFPSIAASTSCQSCITDMATLPDTGRRGCASCWRLPPAEASQCQACLGNVTAESSRAYCFDCWSSKDSKHVATCQQCLMQSSSQAGQQAAAAIAAEPWKCVPWGT